ncbi:hypothetical protein ACFLWU_03145 [Chloroflexota bacterium]
MESKKVLMITRVNVKWDMIEQFNEFWARESLPNWIEHGAKHIGSFENYLGANKNQIVRLWEFDDFPKWAEFMEWRNTGMYGLKELPKLNKDIRNYVENIEETVWFSVY